MSAHTTFADGESTVHGDTEALLRRAQAGDHAALGVLFERYRDRILRSAQVRIGPRLAGKVVAEDIVQETLRVAWENLGSFDARSAPRLIDWLSRIAQNCIRDEVKRWSSEKRDAAREVRMRVVGPDGGPSTFLPIPDDGGTPSQVASAQEQKQIYDECLTQLREHYREVILLKQYADMSWDDIAKHIGSPNAKAAVQLHSRAMEDLESRLRRSGFALPPSGC